MTSNDLANATLARAADWFERLQNEDMDVDTVADWQAWLAASAANREAFNKCQDLWRRLDAVPAPALPSRKEMGLAPGMSPARWALAAGIGAVVLTGAFVLATLAGRDTALTRVYETSTGQLEQARFPDGSRLSLGAKSLVWTEFADTQRKVTLERGEAFFEVAPDGKRPFVVHAGPMSITALGTAFNVRRAGERLLVAVTDGSVKVGPFAVSGGAAAKSDSIHLRAGQMLVLERPGSAPQIVALENGTANAWRDGRLEYRGEPLRSVIADVNRYLQRDVIIADPEVGDLLVTGTLFADSVEAWLRGLDGFLPVYVERDDHGQMILHRRTP